MTLITRLQIVLAVAATAAIAARLLKGYLSRPDIPKLFDRTDVGVADAGTMLVEFTSPYCHECQVAFPLLKAASEQFGAPLAVIDAKQRPDLMAKYSIRTTPVILLVDGRGEVKQSWRSSPSAIELAQAFA